MNDQPGGPVMSSETKRMFDARLSHPLARRAKRGMLGIAELEQLLYDAGADMAEVQLIMDEYRHLYAD